MKTAVEWLFVQMGNVAAGYETELDQGQMLEKAKEMEREQIIEAWDSAYTAEGFFNAEQYYNETFKKQYDIK